MSFDEGRLNELKSALDVKMSEQQQIADSMQFEGDTLVVDDEKKSAFHSNMAEIREIKGLIDDMTTLRDMSAWASEADYKSVAAEVAAGVEAEVAYHQQNQGSVGDRFLQSEEFKSLQGGKAGVNMNAPFMAKSLSTKDIYSGLPTGTPSAFGSVERDGIVPIAQRRNRIRDLFPTRTTNAAVVEYFRQTGFTNAADTVAEYVTGASPTVFGAKPQSSMTFVGEQAPVRTIAHWEAAHRNVLADEPQLRSIIDNELLYGLRLTEDEQILSGSGTGEDLNGILNTSDIQTYAWDDSGSDSKADAIRRAATLAYLSYYEPTGVIVHPSDWEDMELTKNSQGTYLLAMSVANGADQRIWRIPVIDTLAIPEETALVGAFGTGAQLYDREAASIRISEQHSDFFVRNAIVVLAEERLALAVKRPEAFVKVTFDAEPS